MVAEYKGVSLSNPFPNGVGSDEKHLLEPFFEMIMKLKNMVLRGERVYLKITGGEREGSIAYIEKFDPNDQEPYISTNNYLGTSGTDRISNDYYNVILGWDGRRNKIKWQTHYKCEWLIGYTGPTVWKKFDKKAAAEKLLKETRVSDREENILNVGDKVLYINARYGCAASLDRGVIVKIKFDVSKYDNWMDETVHVIIKNSNGETSDIKTPWRSIIKY